MGLRLIRQQSDTPNVQNSDDASLARYAYGDTNGYIKNKGKEIAYSVENENFVLQSGVIVLQGWEVEIDSIGISIPLSTIDADKTYYSVYLIVNRLTDSAEIKSVTDKSDYPDIPESDDLTENSFGSASLLLYRFTSTKGSVENVQKLINPIYYANAKMINGLGVTIDENGVLKIGGTIIPQKTLIWSGNQVCSKNNPYTFIFSDPVVLGDEIEIVGKLAGYDDFVRFRIAVKTALGTYSVVYSVFSGENSSTNGNVRLTSIGYNNVAFNLSLSKAVSVVLKGVDSIYLIFSSSGITHQLSDMSFTVTKIYKIIE